jgi:two-component system, NtrC family, response regulator AtoC
VTSELTVTANDAEAPALPTLMVFWPGGAFARPLRAGSSVVVGRDPKCDIVIAHASVSRSHAQVECTSAGEYLVKDLESSNGTFLGAERVSTGAGARVAIGEEIRVGIARLIIFAPRDPSVDLGGGAGDTEKRPLETVQAYARRIARGDISVLILGETGVGKDVMAELVHRESPRGPRALLRLNCAAVPEALLESELFGHERGAFTGAAATKVGLLEAAAGGSILLDEIGDLSVAAQSKLLRALENREIFRVGSTTPRPIDVRFLAATSRDLGELIAKGTFRADLYYRLSAAVLRVPPLRERTSEIVPLAARFAEDAAAKLGSTPPRISKLAVDALLAHDWPGNVRELKNAIERATLVCEDGELTAEQLDLRRSQPGGTATRAPDAAGARRSRGSREPLETPRALRNELGELEKRRILEALEQCGGNQTRAAKLLGVSRRTFVKRLDLYSITRPKKGAGDDDAA